MTEIIIPGFAKPFVLSSILCVHADGNYSWVYLDNGKRHLTSLTLKWFECRLPGFVRIHRSELINPYHIEKVRTIQVDGYSVELSNGMSLDVARRRSALVRKVIHELELERENGRQINA